MTAATLPISRYKSYNFSNVRLPRPNLWRDGLLVLGAAVGIAQAFHLTPLVDGLIYWQAANLDHLYPATYVAGDPAYVYPPPMAQALAPIHAIGFGLYQIALTTALFGALWYLAGRWSWAFVAGGVAATVLPIPDDFGTVLGYAMNGNIQLFLAVAVVAGFRHPGAWAAPILTKPTMGIGVLWFAFRREWRQTGLAIAATAAVAGISFALAPGLWLDFAAFSLHNSAMPSALRMVPVPLAIRLAMSIALLAWAAPRGHRWAVPVAAGWAIPLLYAGTFVAIWIGAIRLHREPR